MDNVNVFSVFEVTRHLRQVIESSLEPLYVAGEVSSFTHHSSGHMYFNLKDENATLRCTFFKNSNYRLDFKPVEGMQVVCFGKITVFEKGGTYNLNVQSMSQAGLGAMQKKFEELKRKLNQEGLFDAVHKQPIPKYPNKIGIVTSPTGAALQDIQNIIVRRYPAELQVYPALVQGADAAAQIVKGIQYFNQMQEVDIIIVTRGGGSQEDLFCFNDEALARAIFASRIPVISAVGHEIDFTLADFVADLRAPTPSAAAELAVPDKKDLLSLLASLARRLDLAKQKEISSYKQSLAEMQLSLSRYHPEKLWQGYQQRFDMASMGLFNAANVIQQKRQRMELIGQKSLSRLQGLFQLSLNQAKSDMKQTERDLHDGLNDRIEAYNTKLEHSSALLQQLSPRKIQSKGWIMAFKAGKVLSSVTQLKPQDSISLSFVDGIAVSKVESIEELT
ncbi:MAG: exodeoxyribonuclease VII large subunit [Candidatus Cloacimonetes bacterium HGW-Cloacimonetes-3]|jgi:exodeoxyribonuclease VII large subunit|nr:MAG: exodeoxyribonuclease VII large subunit [Candidatus Cloacimonetes bacterium HGW-Cloacimonetes-3]